MLEATVGKRQVGLEEGDRSSVGEKEVGACWDLRQK
jgi:hypothetical protein